MLGLPHVRPPENLDLFAKILARMKEIVAEWDGELHLCYLPSRYRFGVVTSHYAHDTIRSGVLEIANDLNLGIIDLTPVFTEHNSPRLLYASDGHLSIEGAETVAGYIREHGAMGIMAIEKPR